MPLAQILAPVGRELLSRVHTDLVIYLAASFRYEFLQNIFKDHVSLRIHGFQGAKKPPSVHGVDIYALA